MPRLTFDLFDIFRDAVGIARDNYVLWSDPKEAPPAIRHIDASFMSLKDDKDNHHGVFVPELYELAKVNGLIAQQQEATWAKDNKIGTRQHARLVKAQPFYNALYNEDGSRKSAFELAVLPVAFDDHNKKSARGIQKRVEDEFNNRIEQGKALPPVAEKYQITADYLKGISAIGLRATGPRSIKLNIINPSDKTPKIERAAHYFVQRMALAVTFLFALTVTAGTPFLFIAAAAGAVLAKWCGEEFGMFGIAESFLRETKSNFSKEFILGEKISLKKTIKTAVLLAAIGVTAVGVVTATWASVIGLPLWAAVAAKTGLTAATGMQFALAGFIAGLSGLGTLLGGIGAQRFFWGFGIWDKQIDFAKEKAPAAITPKQNMVDKLVKWQHKLAQVMTFPPKVREHAVYQNSIDSLKELTALYKATPEKAKARQAKQDNVEPRPVRKTRAKVA